MIFRKRRGTAPLTWWGFFFMMLIAFLVWLWKIVKPPLPPLSVSLAVPSEVFVGDSAWFSGSVNNSDGTPAKNEAVSLKVYKPDGTVGFEGSATSWGDQDPTNSPPGTYEFAWVATLPEGSWSAETSVRGGVSGKKTFIRSTAWMRAISLVSPLTKFI